MTIILFEEDRDGVLYRDSLELEDDHGLSESEIEALKQERIDNYFALLAVMSEVTDG